MPLFDMNDRPLSWELYNYDGSAKEIEEVYSLNDVLKTGPNYILMLLNTLLKFCTHPVALVAEIEKAFLMVSIAIPD